MVYTPADGGKATVLDVYDFEGACIIPTRCASRYEHLSFFIDPPSTVDLEFPTFVVQDKICHEDAAKYCCFHLLHGID
jgi:hypothetical protein